MHVCKVIRCLGFCPKQNMEKQNHSMAPGSGEMIWGELFFLTWEPSEAGVVRNLTGSDSGCLIHSAYWGGRSVYLPPLSKAGCQRNAKWLFQRRWLIRRDGTDVTASVKVNVFLALKISEKYNCKWKIMTRPHSTPESLPQQLWMPPRLPASC